MYVKKYRNQPTKTSFGSRVYDSKLEAGDALWLRDLQNRGIITDLEEQVRYDFIINGKLLKKYACVDFRCKKGNKTLWIETKGFPTDVWRLKREIIEATLSDDHYYLVNPTENIIQKL